MTFVETSNLVDGALRHIGDNGTNPWTDARIELLTKLWKEGHSAGQIALLLDYTFTRSAVLGKVHRLKLSIEPGIKKHASYGIPGSLGRRPDGYRRKALPKGPQVLRSPRAEPEIIAPVERSEAACTFAELGEDMCRYPYGDPHAPGFTFCGRFTKGTYCSGHQVLCCTPMPPRTDRRR